ncbi:hypothetical protein [Tolypothrix sp. PCC 7601]|uniref:hypothetical protein n=1 Tax=Tolypothrix sp. PCC 7601 TaxID=1188 RepID=UPI0005EAB133|nr:hypothetical protein [Tolypothrix sp. PCC 7601]EKE98962.1 hypothetical protein FDUTEX481_03150 [Tolypothrix sp. PCC 7601]UYD35645.1 hypothetical protein HG267_07745 [Tolypothrix sp. PCC 7601]BAY94791.1 hypothetical protein NIES3275_68450 [Microchaete diplosiphon NIES-3275]
MTKQFCSTDNSKASITVETINGSKTAIFDDPPIKIDVYNSSKKIYLKNQWENTRQLINVIPSNWAGEIFDRNLYVFSEGGWRYYKAGYQSFANLIYTVFFIEKDTPEYATYLVRKYTYETEFSANKMICAYTPTTFYGWEVYDTSAYVVKCDGCLPHETRVNKAKYPGYYCLDCEAIDSRLRRVGDKLDGANR